MRSCGLELNLGKTRIVYCKDSHRFGSHEHERFDFLGYTFRPRQSRDGKGAMFVNFTPAISDEAAKEDPANGQAMEDSLMERNTPHRDSTGDQQNRARMDQLLREVLPVDVDPIAQKHRHVFGAMGDAQVQATEAPPYAGMGVSGRRGNTRARDSLLTGESYAHSTEWWEPYESRGSRTVLREPGAATPRATHQDRCAAASCEARCCAEGLPQEAEGCQAFWLRTYCQKPLRHKESQAPQVAFTNNNSILSAKSSASSRTNPYRSFLKALPRRRRHFGEPPPAGPNSSLARPAPPTGRHDQLQLHDLRQLCAPQPPASPTASHQLRAPPTSFRQMRPLSAPAASRRPAPPASCTSLAGSANLEASPNAPAQRRPA